MLTASSRSVEVEELGHGVQFLLEDEHPLVLDHVPDLALRIQQVAELPRTDRAHLDARRVAPRTHALDAEGALLDDALGTRPVAQVVRLRVQVVAGDGRLGPVEVPRAVRARGHAVATAHAPVSYTHLRAHETRHEL